MWNGGFYPDPSIRSRVFAENLNPMMYLLEYSDDPYRVIDGESVEHDYLNKSPSQKGISLASPLDLKF